MPDITTIPGTGPFALHFILRPGAAPDDAGDVYLFISPSARVPVKVSRRTFRIMRVLIDAWKHDVDIELRDLPGLRSRDAIARAYADGAGDRATIHIDSVSSYVQKFRKALRAALAEAGRLRSVTVPDELPEVVVGVRGRGYRIGDFGVEVHDYSRAVSTDFDGYHDTMYAIASG